MAEMLTSCMSRLRMLPAGVVPRTLFLQEVCGEARTPMASRPRILFPVVGKLDTQGTEPARVCTVWVSG